MYSNYKLTELELKNHNKGFDLLCNEFVPGCDKTPYQPKQGKHDYFKSTNFAYTVESQPDRKECVVKEGKTKLFELYLATDDNFVVHTRGRFLKRLSLNKELLEKIKNNLQYKASYDMKHYFEINVNDLPYICKAYKNIESDYDNGLIKNGERE